MLQKDCKTIYKKTPTVYYSSQHKIMMLNDKIYNRKKLFDKSEA